MRIDSNLQWPPPLYMLVPYDRHRTNLPDQHNWGSGSPDYVGRCQSYSQGERSRPRSQSSIARREEPRAGGYKGQLQCFGDFHMIQRIVILLRRILPGVETHEERMSWRREMLAEIRASEQATGNWQSDRYRVVVDTQRDQRRD